LAADIKASDPTQLFEEIWPKLREDLNAIKQEISTQGYKVLILRPLRVSLHQLRGRLGFLVVLSREKADELLNVLRMGLHYTVDMEFGLHKQLAVFVIILKFAETKQAVVYPVYYHTNLEWFIKDQGKQGLYTFFSVQGGNVIGEIYLGSHKAYLYSQYVR
jgi:hypothetical protein